jgi:hypothetical protein
MFDTDINETICFKLNDLKILSTQYNYLLSEYYAISHVKRKLTLVKTRCKFDNEINKLHLKMVSKELQVNAKYYMKS